MSDTGQHTCSVRTQFQFICVHKKLRLSQRYSQPVSGSQCRYSAPNCTDIDKKFGKHASKFIVPLSEVQLTVTEPIFTKLALLRQFVVKTSCAEFRENPTGGSVADTRSPHTAFLLLGVSCLRCTNVHSTCHCPMPPDPGRAFLPTVNFSKLWVPSSSLRNKCTAVYI